MGLATLLCIESARANFQLTLLATLNGFTDGTDIVGLSQGKDGNFYGVAAGSGLYEEDNGTVFKMTLLGAVTVLADFDPTNGPPTGPLMQATDGAFYGVRGIGVFRITTNGDLSTVTMFTPTNDSGSRAYAPNGPLAQGRDGNFYGTTEYGGFGVGSVFKLTPAGEVTTLASFTFTNGGFPTTGVVLGNDGNFYGTTSGGSQPSYGAAPATVFKIIPEGALTTLGYFDPTNDADDTPGLVLGSDGNFYGTTRCGPSHTDGTVFRVTPSGDFTILSRFTNGDFFLAGQTGLAQGPDGNLYGTTISVGGNQITKVFQMTPDGVIISVANLPAGLAPSAGPVVGNDGKLYIAYNGYIYVLVPPPALQAITKEGGNATLTSSAAIGQKYQAQCTTNLTLTNWLPVGAPITATNLTITITDSSGADTQRFYRVQLLP